MKMHEAYEAYKDAMNKIGQPAEPKPELVECAIVELLDLAQRQGITPADFIQLLDYWNANIRVFGSVEAAYTRQRQHRLRFLVHWITRELLPLNRLEN